MNTFYPQVTARWVKRAETQGFKPKTKKYADAQLEFFIGASVGCSIATGNNMVGMGLLALSVGRDSRDLWPTYTEYLA